MFHYENDQWVDITDPTSRDTVSNTVCGTTTSLSPFTLFDVKYPFTGFFSPVENLPTDSAWGGSCRELQVQFDDGEAYRARFTMWK